MDREELLHRFPDHRDKLVAALMRLVGRTDAEDLANETLLRAMAAIASFRGEASLGTWLHRIGMNLAYDWLRRQGRDPVANSQEHDDALDVIPAADNADPIEQRQMSQCMQEVLAGLPAAQRQLLVQADVLDQTTPEIAQQAGITAGNAKIRLHRARKTFQSALQERCDFHHRDGGILCCTPKPE